jgi:phosphoribosylformylglycinamidine (FGAM) synthase PurS component
MGVFTEENKAAIFGTTLEKMNTAAAESLNKSVERLTKNYEEYLKRPTNAAKPTPSETLRKLVRNLVAIDITRPLFVTQAAAFGATEAQANRLYDLAMTERSLRKGEETSTTKMGVLIDYITSDASLQNDPKLRLEAIKSWLKRNGYTSQAADNSAAAIDAAFDEHVVAAQVKAMEKFEIKISSRKQAELKKKLDELAEERITNAMNDIRDRLSTHLKRMSDRLTTDYVQGEAKQRRFHDSLVEGALELCDLTKALNVVGDATLEGARKELEGLLVGVTAQELRKNEAIRQDTKKAVDAILDKFSF